jgi:hypothetical protein
MSRLSELMPIFKVDIRGGAHGNVKVNSIPVASEGFIKQ